MSYFRQSYEIASQLGLSPSNAHSLKGLVDLLPFGGG